MSGRDESWTVLRVLAWTADRFGQEGLGSPRLDAELLLAHCLGVERVRLYMDHEKPLLPEELGRYRELVRRRLRREPVAYITGTREFWSLPLVVSDRVLVPRPETETLVEQALRSVAELELDAPLIVDVGTGSGAIALALASELPRARILALDVDPAALEVAAENARRLELELTLLRGDLLDALPADTGPLDLVVANLPYVARSELDGLEPEVARWEPRRALDGGPDGLDPLRRLVAQAAARLGAGRALALEIGAEQAPAVTRLCSGHGFEGVRVVQDLAGLDRVVCSLRPRRP